MTNRLRQKWWCLTSFQVKSTKRFQVPLPWTLKHSWNSTNVLRGHQPTQRGQVYVFRLTVPIYSQQWLPDTRVRKPSRWIQPQLPSNCKDAKQKNKPKPWEVMGKLLFSAIMLGSLSCSYRLREQHSTWRVSHRYAFWDISWKLPPKCFELSLGFLAEELQPTFIPSPMDSLTTYMSRKVIVRKVILLLAFDLKHRQISSKPGRRESSSHRTAF